MFSDPYRGLRYHAPRLEAVKSRPVEGTTSSRPRHKDQKSYYEANKLTEDRAHNKHRNVCIHVSKHKRFG